MMYTEGEPRDKQPRMDSPPPQEQSARHSGEENMTTSLYNGQNIPHTMASMQYSDSMNRSDDSQGSPNSDLGYIPSRKQREFIPENRKDNFYWEKRRKNNEAARRSREKRRIHDYALENQICDIQDENRLLRKELIALKKKFGVPLDKCFTLSDEEHSDTSLSGRPLARPGASASSSLPHPSHPDSLSQTTTYTSPPPLLAVAGAVPMSVPVQGLPYTNGATFPYYLMPSSEAHPRMHPDFGAYRGRPESQRMNPDTLEGNSVPSTSSNPLMPGAGSSLYSQGRIKSEPEDDGHRSSHDRSSHDRSSHDKSSHDRSLSSHDRSSHDRSSHDRSSHDRSSHDRSSHDRSSHDRPSYDRPPVPVRDISPESTHRGEYQRPLDHDSQNEAWLDSNSNSYSSDDLMDEEPLSLTAMGSKEGELSNQMQFSANRRDTRSPQTTLPLKLRHKELYGHSSSSYSTHPYMDGLAQLSEIALAQANPLPLVKKRDREFDREHGGLSDLDLDPKFLDPKYLERRRRNNEAARKCRENRKALTRLREAKSDYLEDENSKLRNEMGDLSEEVKQLRDMIEKKHAEQDIAGPSKSRAKRESSDSQ